MLDVDNALLNSIFSYFANTSRYSLYIFLGCNLVDSKKYNANRAYIAQRGCGYSYIHSRWNVSEEFNEAFKISVIPLTTINNNFKISEHIIITYFCNDTKNICDKLALKLLCNIVVNNFLVIRCSYSGFLCVSYRLIMKINAQASIL